MFEHWIDASTKPNYRELISDRGERIAIYDAMNGKLYWLDGLKITPDILQIATEFVALGRERRNASSS